MSVQLSESLEDYLEAIAELIAVEGHAHTKEIAGKLHVKMPSVTAALRQLEKMGLIIYNTHYPVQLTVEGKGLADEVLHRHSVLKSFFMELLGLPPDKASETACRIEHVVDADTIRRFVLFSESIGNREDAKALQTYLTEAISVLDSAQSEDWCLLPLFQPGDTIRIVKIGRNIIKPEELPFRTGDAVAVSGRSLDKSSMKFLMNGVSFELPNSVVENIWGIPCKVPGKAE